MGNYLREPILEEKIILRKLELADAEPMLEWIKDPDIYLFMKYDHKSQNIKTCRNFIVNSWEDKQNLHYAIANNNNQYYGTISLKNLDLENKSAELGIVVVKKSLGKNVAMKALVCIMYKAFEELGLSSVYLFVRADNLRALKFYKKCDLCHEVCSTKQIKIKGEYKDIYCYSLLKDDYYDRWKKKI